MKIHIENVGRKVTADSLAAIFSTYGKVSSSIILSPLSASHGSRKALVIMPDEKAATTAIGQLNGSFIDGYSLCVAGPTPEARFSFRLFYQRVFNCFQ